MQLVCPAGNLAALKAAVQNGANTVYLGFKDQTNARSFEGLNFSPKELTKAIAFAHQHQVTILLAINTYPRDPDRPRWTRAIDLGAELGVDGFIVADPGLLAYATKHHPNTARHLSVQGSVVSAAGLRLYHERYGIKRAVLPRVLDFTEIASMCAEAPVEIEVFGFGSLCVMTEGRCLLSSWLCGESPNSHGACSPSRFVDWQQHDDASLDCRLGHHLLDRYQPGEAASYPTICKGRYQVNDQISYAFEQPCSLNLLPHLARLKQCGVHAIKIEGRQRSPAYVATVTRLWRKAIDALHIAPAQLTPNSADMAELLQLSEGLNTTCGAFLKESY